MRLLSDSLGGTGSIVLLRANMEDVQVPEKQIFALMALSREKATSHMKIVDESR